jgi:transposase
VRRWRDAYRRRGEAGLDAKPAPGAPPRLSRQQKRGLVRQLLKGARVHGFPTDLWTCRRIAELIEQRYGVPYHKDHVSRLMHQLGFTAQKPTRRAMERDEEAIQHWIGHEWPRIKKRRPAARRTSSSSTKAGSR